MMQCVQVCNKTADMQMYAVFNTNISVEHSLHSLHRNQVKNTSLHPICQSHTPEATHLWCAHFTLGACPFCVSQPTLDLRDTMWCLLRTRHTLCGHVYLTDSRLRSTPWCWRKPAPRGLYTVPITLLKILVKVWETHAVPQNDAQ